MNLAISEFKRLAARLAELQEYSGWRLGLFSWHQPSASTSEEHPGLSLSDACGYLSVETNSISLYQSTLWRHATTALDDKGDPIYEEFVDTDGHPVIVGGQQLLIPQLEDEERRGIVLTDSSLPPEPTLFLRNMHGNGGESRLFPHHKVLLELLEQAGHTLRETSELIQLLWNDNLPAQSVDPLVLWISSVVELAHRKELIGDLVQQGWWWWKSPSGGAMCESQIAHCDDDRGEFDKSRRACKILKPTVASSQTIAWMLHQAEASLTERSSKFGTRTTSNTSILVEVQPRHFPAKLISSTARIISSIEAAQQRFVAISERQLPIATLLVHQSGFEHRPQPSWPEGFEQQGHSMLSMKMGPYFDPTVIIDGRPATTSLSRTRQCRYYGRNKPGRSPMDYSESIAEYFDTAAEAGILVDQLEPRVKTIIWQEWPNGFNKPSFDSLWTNAVFELAWQTHPGSALRAKRWVWRDNQKLEVNDISRVKIDMLDGMFASLLANCGDPPAYYYSWIPNLARASWAAVELVKELLINASSGDWQESTLSLSQNKLDILKALSLKAAFDPDHRQTAADIAFAVAGNDADVNAFKDPLSELVRDGFLESKKGRGGGYWLTQTGKERAERL